jgi:hypothetical protein
MGPERRDRADQGQTEANPAGKEPRIGPKPRVKSFEIPKRLVFQAWEKVRANNGAPGVDAVSITEFAAREKDNLYRLWNRMSWGSYFPGPVRAVEIPKDHGAGVRILGVPRSAMMRSLRLRRTTALVRCGLGGPRLSARRTPHGQGRLPELTGTSLRVGVR